jgi:hypothetical protein
LRSVTFCSTGSAIAAGTRVLTITAFDDTSLVSNSVTRQITVTTTNASPTLSGSGGNQSYAQQPGPISIAPGLAVADADSLSLASATISFTNWQAGDRLTFNNVFALQHAFVQDLTAHTATLIFTGFTSAANYQTTLRSIAFYNVAAKPVKTSRVYTFTVSDGFSTSNTVSGTITFA